MQQEERSDASVAFRIAKDTSAFLVPGRHEIVCRRVCTGACLHADFCKPVSFE